MSRSKHVRACLWLLAATAVWGLSFPFIKATWLAQQKLAPETTSIFFAAVLAVVRFGLAAIVIALFTLGMMRRRESENGRVGKRESGKTGEGSPFSHSPTHFLLRPPSPLPTRLEWEQGLGLGVFGGLGILLQMDGLAHTSASTSAFLTQFYCLVIPIWVAWRTRALPKFAVVLSSVMVLSGVAILSRFDWREFKMGRGEAETLLAALFFAGQMLWLERPRYGANRVSHFTVIMFGTICLLVLPVGIFTAPASRAWVSAWLSPGVIAFVAVITIGCTIIAYTVMNAWQPHVTATEAGLIYCVEPLYASVFALFLPAWLSRVAGIDYANETVTTHLIVGGGLITAANVLIQLEAMLVRRRAKRVGAQSSSTA